MRSVQDAKAWLSQDCVGSAETGAAPWWRVLMKYRPDAKVVIVRRPVEEVVDSLMKIDLHGESPFDRSAITAGMRRLDAKLGQIEARWPGALSVRFDDLRRESECGKVFEHCLGIPHDSEWWHSLCDVNVQRSMIEMVRYAKAFKGPLAALAQQATSACLASISSKSVRTSDGIALQCESFETFLRDGDGLIREHLASVGEDGARLEEKNIPLMREIDAKGNIQVVTARSNGRIFGYLMTIICPSLEHFEASAVHTARYSSSEFPGLGMKIQREADNCLRRRGVSEVIMRTGIRGDGPRLATMYRRAGAAHDGELYRLDLRAS